MFVEDDEDTIVAWTRLLHSCLYVRGVQDIRNMIPNFAIASVVLLKSLRWIFYGSPTMALIGSNNSVYIPSSSLKARLSIRSVRISILEF